jgi:hypothetical protein
VEGEYNVSIGFGRIMLASTIGKVRVRLGNMLWFLQLVLVEFFHYMCGVKRWICRGGRV